MDEIARLRTRIDEIDQDILQLLKKRYENARLLGRVKRAKGVDTRDPPREKTILRKVQHTARKLGLNPKYAARIFNEIFKLSIEAQLGHAENSNALHGKNVLIIGGTGGMGSFFTRLAYAYGATVTIVGRNTSRTRRVARELGVEAGSMLDARTSDIVVVAVPLDNTKQVSVEVASLMRDGALLTDLSSVKSGIADEIWSKISRALEYVSIHPLFGPDVDQVNQQNLVAIPFRTGPQWRSFSQILQRAGARVHVTSKDHHDRAMAYVQVLHHFALICLASSLENWNGELKTYSINCTIEKIRALLKNWDTIAGIQGRNPYAQSARENFVEISRTLVTMRTSQQEKSRKTLSANVQKWSRKL